MTTADVRPKPPYTGRWAGLTVEERLLAKVIHNEETGCWIWTASLDGKGYGQMYADGAPRKAYRVAYELFVGKVPEGLQLDHLCRVRHCVNPWHLEPVTQQENLRRGAAARTHCVNGHPFAGDNLAILPSGTRRCRTCNRDRVRELRARRRVSA